jgi:uncharacterized protein (DUF58 family)
LPTKQRRAITKYLDPEVVSRVANMELKARLIVEGFIAGMHRSPYHGFSVEEETNLKSTILLDKSGSMGFTSREDRVDKLTYGSLLAASIAFLLIRQQDAVGLALFDDQIQALLPHRSVRKHLWFLLENLDRVEPGAQTRISPALHYIAERIRRRGLIILISDLMDDPDKVLLGLKHFRHRKHEIIVFHVLDPRELDLDYRDEVEFRDLETERRVRVEPQFLRREYAERVQEWLTKLDRGCKGHQIDYNLLRTDTPFDQALTAFVNKRFRMG